VRRGRHKKSRFTKRSGPAKCCDDGDEPGIRKPSLSPEPDQESISSSSTYRSAWVLTLRQDRDETTRLETPLSQPRMTAMAMVMGHVADGVTTARKILVGLAVIVGVLFLCVMGIVSVAGRDVVISIVDVPKSFEERGLTRAAVSGLLLDDINAIKESTETHKFIQDYVAHSLLADVEVPGAKVSFRNLVRFIRDQIGLRPDLELEGTIYTAGEHGELLCSRVFRRNASDFGGRIGCDDDIDKLLQNTAEAIIYRLDPYILARYYEVRNPAKARKCAQHCLSHEPTSDDKWAYEVLGNLALRERRWDEAIARYKAGARLDPEWSIPYINIGWALYQQRKFDEAIQNLERSVRLRPYAIAYTNWSAVLLKKKDYWGAIDKCKESLKHGTRQAAYLNWGIALRGLGKFEEACEKFREAIDIDPDNTLNPYFGWGKTLIAEGKPREAIEKLTIANELSPTEHTVHFQLGLAHEKLGQKDAARAEFLRARELGSREAAAKLRSEDYAETDAP